MTSSEGNQFINVAPTSLEDQSAFTKQLSDRNLSVIASLFVLELQAIANQIQVGECEGLEHNVFFLAYKASCNFLTAIYPALEKSLKRLMKATDKSQKEKRAQLQELIQYFVHIKKILLILQPNLVTLVAYWLCIEDDLLLKLAQASELDPKLFSAN